MNRRIAIKSAAATAAVTVLGVKMAGRAEAAVAAKAPVPGPGTTSAGVKPAALSPVPCGINYTNETVFDNATSTKAQIVRIYHTPAQGIPSSLSADSQVLTALKAGQQVITSYKPSMPGTSAQVAAFTSWCESVAGAGYAGEVWATVWHEPENNFATAADYVAEYMQFQPAAAASGIKFGPIFTTYPFLRKGFVLANWMPADDDFSYIGIDHYAGADPAGTFTNPLQSISQFTSYAKSRGKVFGIAETGVAPDLYTTAQTQAEAAAFIEDYESLGSSVRFMLMFNDPSADVDITANGGALIPAWQQLYNTLTTR
ncbi:MAG TPA: hypothetical protein VHY31_13290 [Streptosporangiaceae bacterium]|nr:hypothetical protein [Streptosporangiaceae bacterium]